MRRGWGFSACENWGGDGVGMGMERGMGGGGLTAKETFRVLV